VKAGYGYGLCSSYTDSASCKKDVNRMPNENIFSVHYSRVTLITSLAGAHATCGLWEPDHRRTENFELGYNARYKNLEEAYYWEAVRDELCKVMARLSGTRPVGSC